MFTFESLDPCSKPIFHVWICLRTINAIYFAIRNMVKMWTVSILLVCTVVSCFSCQILDNPFYTGCFLDFKKLKKWLVTQWTVYVTYDLEKCDQYHFQFLTKHCVYLKCFQKEKKAENKMLVHTCSQSIGGSKHNFFHELGVACTGWQVLSKGCLVFLLNSKKTVHCISDGPSLYLLFRWASYSWLPTFVGKSHI